MNLEYLVGSKTNGANPFKIWKALADYDADKLAFVVKRMPYPVFIRSAYWFAVATKAKANAGMRIGATHGLDNSRGYLCGVSEYSVARAHCRARLPAEARNQSEAMTHEPPTDWTSFLSTLGESERYEAEERAAIHEFDGGLSREGAELITMQEYQTCS